MSQSEQESYEEEVLKQTQREWQRDLISETGWRQVSFISYSRGRRKFKIDPTKTFEENEELRKNREKLTRQQPRYVTITWYNNKPITGKKGSRTDKKAAETFGNTVAGEDQLSRLETVLRRLTRR